MWAMCAAYSGDLAELPLNSVSDVLPSSNCFVIEVCLLNGAYLFKVVVDLRDSDSQRCSIRPWLLENMWGFKIGQKC